MSVTAALIVSGIVSALSSGVGAYVQNKQMGEARDEARALNNQQIEMQKENNAFNRSLAMKQLREGRQAREFNEDMQKANLATTRATSAFQMTRAGVEDIEKMLNTNIGLKNMVLNRWKAA